MRVRYSYVQLVQLSGQNINTAKTVRYNRAYFIDVEYLNIKFWKGQLLIGIVGTGVMPLGTLLINPNDTVQITQNNDETHIRIM